jgi:hypothetical protein
MAQFFEGSPAVLNEQAPVRALRSDTVNMPIAAGASNVSVVDARVTANSIIVLMATGATADTTGKNFSVSAIEPNVGFTISCGQQLTAAKVVRYAILQY